MGKTEIADTKWVLELVELVEQRLSSITTVTQPLDSLRKLKSGKKIPVYAPLIRSDLKIGGTDLEIRFLLSPESWSLLTFLPNGEKSDLGIGLYPLCTTTTPKELSLIIYEAIKSIVDGCISVVAHCEKGVPLICQVYANTNNGFTLLCTRFTYAPANPLVRINDETILDARCDRVVVYQGTGRVDTNTPSGVAHFQSRNTETNLVVIEEVNKLKKIKPAKQKIQFSHN